LIVDVAGIRQRVLARAVIDASGSLSEHNPLGSAGVPAIGEPELADRIAYGLPDVLAQHERYAGKRVLVIGAGHSAMNVLQDLVALRRDAPDTRIMWAVRRAPDDELFGGGERDGLPERAALGRAVEALARAGEVELRYGVRIEALEQTPDGVVAIHEGGAIGPVDEIVAATGFRPGPRHAARASARARQLRRGTEGACSADRSQRPLLRVRAAARRARARPPRARFYLAGMKSYGRAPTFLMLTGYEQVRSIAAALAATARPPTAWSCCCPRPASASPHPRYRACRPGGCCLPTIDDGEAVATAA
jgi:hypothetical protein